MPSLASSGRGWGAVGRRVPSTNPRGSGQFGHLSLCVSSLLGLWASAPQPAQPLLRIIAVTFYSNCLQYHSAGSVPLVGHSLAKTTLSRTPREVCVLAVLSTTPPPPLHHVTPTRHFPRTLCPPPSSWAVCWIPICKYSKYPLAKATATMDLPDTEVAHTHSLSMPWVCSCWAVFPLHQTAHPCFLRVWGRRPEH